MNTKSIGSWDIGSETERNIITFTGKDYPADDDTWEPKENISEAALRVWERRKDVQQGTA